MSHEENRKIFKNLIHVDLSLESLNVPVPHTRNNIECRLLITGQLILFFFIFFVTCVVNFSSRVLNSIYLSKLAYFSIVNISYLVLFTYFYLIGNIVRERLRLTRCTFNRLARDNPVSYTHLIDSR